MFTDLVQRCPSIGLECSPPSHQLNQLQRLRGMSLGNAFEKGDLIAHQHKVVEGENARRLDAPDVGSKGLSAHDDALVGFMGCHGHQSADLPSTRQGDAP